MSLTPLIQQGCDEAEATVVDVGAASRRRAEAHQPRAEMKSRKAVNNGDASRTEEARGDARHIRVEWEQPPFGFGELIQVKEAKERSVGRKRDWEPRIGERRYLDHHGRTGGVLATTAKEIVMGRGAHCVPFDPQWSYEGCQELKELP